MRRVLIALGMALLAGHAAAQSYTATVLINADNNAGTGCTVVTPSGNVNGVEARLDASIGLTGTATAASTTATVNTQSLRTCTGGVFGVPQALTAGFAARVDATDGTLASVELGFDGNLVSTPANLTWTLAYFMERGDRPSSDLVAPTAFSLFLAAVFPSAPVAIPGLGGPAMALLLGAMAWLASRRLAASPGLTRSVVLALAACCAAGAVWAAAITLDGNMADWAGVPATATDAQRDALGVDANVEIQTAYATSNGTQAYFRIDLAASSCGVFFGGGYTICIKGRTVLQERGNDGTFEQAWVVVPGTMAGNDGQCPAGTSFHTEIAAQQVAEPAFYTFITGLGFGHFDDLCLR
jgi:hypothetical protein